MSRVYRYLYYIAMSNDNYSQRSTLAAIGFPYTRGSVNCAHNILDFIVIIELFNRQFVYNLNKPVATTPSEFLRKLTNYFYGR